MRKFGSSANVVPVFEAVESRLLLSVDLSGSITPVNVVLPTPLSNTGLHLQVVENASPGPGLASYTIHAVGVDADSMLAGIDVRLDGYIHQVWNGFAQTPDINSAAGLTPDQLARDSHILLDSGNVIVWPGGAINETNSVNQGEGNGTWIANSATHNMGFSIYGNDQQLDQPLMQLVIAAGHTVRFTGDLIDHNIRHYHFNVVFPLTTATADFNYTITNTGDTATGGFWTDFVVSPDPTLATDLQTVGHVRISSIPAGGSYPATLSGIAFTPNGPMYAGMALDTGHEVTGTVAGTVIAGMTGPDLKISTFTYGAGEYLPGETVGFSATIANQGNIDLAGQSVTLDVHLSTNSIWGDGDDVSLYSTSFDTGLQAGASKVLAGTQALPADLALGNYYMLAKVSTTSTELKTDNNNFASATAGVRVVSQAVLNFDAKHKASFKNLAGVLVTVSMSGQGNGTITFLHHGNADPIKVEVWNTTGSSSVTITAPAKTAPTPVGDVHVYGALRSFTAKSIDVTGGMVFDNSLATLTLGAVTHTDLITIGPRLADDIRTTFTGSFAHVADLSLTSLIPIRSLTAYDWQNLDLAADTITAPKLGTLTIKGYKRLNIRGDFEAGLDLNLTVAAIGLLPTDAVLSSAKVAGWIHLGTWHLNGNVKSITADALDAATLLVGASGVTGNVSDFDDGLGGSIQYTLGTLTLKGLAPAVLGQPYHYFDNSNVAAWNITTVKFAKKPAAVSGKIETHTTPRKTNPLDAPPADFWTIV